MMILGYGLNFEYVLLGKRYCFNVKLPKFDDCSVVLYPIHSEVFWGEGHDVCKIPANGFVMTIIYKERGETNDVHVRIR